VDFRFTDEQVALRDAMQALSDDMLSLDNVGAPAPGLWPALTDMGVFGLLLPDEPGGAVEAAIACEVLAAHLVTGPVLWSTLATRFASGRITGVIATAERPLVIEHARESAVVIVVHDDQVEACDAPPGGVEGEPLDPLTPAVAFDELPMGRVVGAGADAEWLRNAGTVLASAMLVGVARSALDVAAAYAQERHQFGVPIGSFQAIKHILADMYVRTELARSATYAAAAIFDDARGGNLADAASAAKLLAGDAGIANGRAAVQVLGGMGFTWEMLPHYFLKRAWVLENAFGTSERHALALSDAGPAWT
jgi:alkylation response protein AidB-like acyl-CoA dehydrogenase